MAVFSDYAPYTENELGHEIVKIKILSDGKPIDAILELNDEYGDDVEITLTVEGDILKSQAHTFFEALNKLRVILEKDNKQLVCFGTCENVYPSAMQLDMGVGRLAYRCTLGMQAKNEDIVDIFNSDSSCVPASIEAQKQFNDKWVHSIISRTKEADTALATTKSHKKSFGDKVKGWFGK